MISIWLVSFTTEKAMATVPQNSQIQEASCMVPDEQLIYDKLQAEIVSYPKL